MVRSRSTEDEASHYGNYENYVATFISLLQTSRLSFPVDQPTPMSLGVSAR